MTPNEVTYTTLNNGHCKEGKIVIYHALVDHMKENGCDQPNIHTNNLLMNGFHKENDLIQIRRLRGYTMKSTMHVYYPSKPVDDMKLNNVITMAYNALIVRFNICTRMGEVSFFQWIQVH